MMVCEPDACFFSGESLCHDNCTTVEWVLVHVEVEIAVGYDPADVYHSRFSVLVSLLVCFCFVIIVRLILGRLWF
jgi:hypothetical protein